MVRIGSIEFQLNLKDNFTKVMSRARKVASSTATSMKKKFLEASLAIKAAFLGIGFVMVRVFKEIVENTNTAERANARLVQQLKNIGETSDDAAQRIRKQAEALQTLTGISNDEIISSAALAASFALNAKQIEQLLPRLADLTAFSEKANGSVVAMEDSVKVMGQVLEGNIGRLRIMGITLTEVEAEMISTGDKAAKLAGFLSAIDNNAGGVAEAMAKTSSGAMKTFGNDLEDLTKQIGKGLNPVLGKLAKAASFLSTNLIRGMKLVGLSIGTNIAKMKALLNLIKNRDLEAFQEQMERISAESIALLDDIVGATEEVIEVSEELTDTWNKEEEQIITLSDRIKENNDERRKLAETIILEGDASGELTKKLKELGIENLNLISQEERINELLDTQVEKAQSAIEALIKLGGREAEVALRKNQAIILEEEFRKKIIENAIKQGETAEEAKRLADEAIEKAIEEGKVIISAKEDIIEKNKEINDKEKETAKERKESLTQTNTLLKTQLELLESVRLKILELNETPLESKEATFTIRIRETTSTAAEDDEEESDIFDINQ